MPPTPQYLAILILLPMLCLCLAAGDQEDVSHGTPSEHGHGRAKVFSERLQEKGGEHEEHMDHQAFLGDKELASQYDDLPTDVAKARLRVLASKQIDKNADGFVTDTELIDWIHRSLISLDREETDERFDEMDTDKDGIVSWGEYMQEAFGVESGKETERFMDSPEDMKLMKEDRKYFGAADQDRDMALSRLEFAAFQNPEHFPHMHQVLVENTMLEKDTDGDGRISLKEFLGETYDQPNSEWYLTEKNRFDVEYDKDRDGYLSGEEINAWLIPDIRTTAKQEAEHLIKVADTDKDGELSIDEIVDAHKAFVGSEATAYGEKLMEMRHDEL